MSRRRSTPSPVSAQAGAGGARHVGRASVPYTPRGVYLGGGTYRIYPALEELAGMSGHDGLRATWAVGGTWAAAMGLLAPYLVSTRL